MTEGKDWDGKPKLCIVGPSLFFSLNLFTNVIHRFIHLDHYERRMNATTMNDAILERKKWWQAVGLNARRLGPHLFLSIFLFFFVSLTFIGWFRHCEKKMSLPHDKGFMTGSGRRLWALCHVVIERLIEFPGFADLSWLSGLKTKIFVWKGIRRKVGPGDLPVTDGGKTYLGFENGECWYNFHRDISPGFRQFLGPAVWTPRRVWLFISWQKNLGSLPAGYDHFRGLSLVVQTALCYGL